MLNKNDKRPLYDQLVNVLKDKIENEMQANDKMLSEREISNRYGVSRTTVRLAMTELENMGYIYKRHGKGTFVSALHNQKQNLMDNYSFTDHMRQLGKKPQTKVLSFEIIKSSQFFAENLGIDEGEKMIKIKRLRLADNLPMMLERSYLPFNEFATLTEDRVKHKPLYEIFHDDFNEIVKAADEEFSAGIVSDSESEQLDVLRDSPCLKLVRTTYNTENKVIEYTLSIARSDQFVYRVRHER